MKNKMSKKITITASLLLIFTLFMSGCAAQNNSESNSASPTQEPSPAASQETSTSQEQSQSSENSSSDTPDSSTQTDLEVSFGDNGAPFTMHIYDNPTAAAIATYVGTADWRLPIRNFDNYDNWEIMQYYDLPSSYNIPSSPETVTSVKSGEVYYSDPNRIVLFYGDGEVSGEYTRVGYFDNSEEFVTAVRENPVQEGWGNKIVKISDGNN